MATVSPFTKAVVASMRHLYPECLAERSFDNTGLLLESPTSPQTPPKSNSVLLTIDLTRAVADEAIKGNHSVVVAYHPIIFRGLKAITFDDSQQSTLLRLASQGVSVYCPHTAVDTVPEGMADWLCDIVTGKLEPRQSSSEVSNNKAKPDQQQNVSERTFSGPFYPSKDKSLPRQDPNQSTSHPNIIDHERSVITPSPAGAIETANVAHQKAESSSPYNTNNTGAGRLVTFNQPQPLFTLITRIAAGTGLPKGFPVAIPQFKSLDSISIRTVGICPGSGSSVLHNCSPPPDLIFTGELSHHEALAVTERGGSVITLFHSNSERGYLQEVMRDRLERELERRWRSREREPSLSSQEEDEGDLDADSSVRKVIENILADGSVEVVISRQDRDPFGIVVF